MGDIERYQAREMTASTGIIDTEPSTPTIIAHVGLRSDAEKIVRALNDHRGVVEALLAAPMPERELARLSEVEALCEQLRRAVDLAEKAVDLAEKAEAEVKLLREICRVNGWPDFATPDTPPAGGQE